MNIRSYKPRAERSPAKANDFLRAHGGVRSVMSRAVPERHGATCHSGPARRDSDHGSAERNACCTFPRFGLRVALAHRGASRMQEREGLAMLSPVRSTLGGAMERFQRQRSVGGGPWRAALFAAAAIVPIGTAAGFEWVHRPIPPAPPVEPRAPSFDRTFDAAHFLKGNIHAHTKRSDG